MDPISTWGSLAKMENMSCCSERHARRIVRNQRLQRILEKCLCEMAIRKLSKSRKVEEMLRECHNAVSVSFADVMREKVNHQLYDNKYCRLRDDKESIRQQAISFKRDDADCLHSLQMIHFFLYRGCANDSTESTNVSRVVDSSQALSTIEIDDILKNAKHPVFKYSAPEVDLTAVTDSIHHAQKKRTCIVDKGLIQEHYVSTGIIDDPLFSYISEHDVASLDSPALHQGDDETLSDTDDIFDGIVLNEDRQKQSQRYLNDFLAIQDSNPTRNEDSTDPVSLVESIATTAKNNLSAMKLDVDKSLQDARSSERHLLNYNDFIEKKNMQRVQCLRDLQEHCCICKGPHIEKPPFSHGKDYRREPTHTKCQKEKCAFLRKKKRELEWLDETLAKYDNNQKRFKREIADREDKIQRKKVIMKEALANSLKLMEML